MRHSETERAGGEGRGPTVFPSVLPSVPDPFSIPLFLYLFFLSESELPEGAALINA